MNLQQSLMLLAAYWFCFWAVAQVSQYNQSLEYQQVFTAKRSRILKLVLFVLWPVLAPLGFIIVTLAAAGSK